MMLADSRFPGGGHVHSGGLEEAAARGLIRTESDLPRFLRTRLHTAGALAATFAAAAAHASRRGADLWAELDAELDARTPSAAQRAASRAQGRATTRAAQAIADNATPVDNRTAVAENGRGQQVAWKPGAGGQTGSLRTSLTALLAATPRPHHAIVLGVLAGDVEDAASAAAYLSVSGPASASVRLLGLDPLQVNAIVWELAPLLHSVAAQAAATAGENPADLPAPGSPGLDLLAEEHDRHHREEVRLFAS